MSSSVGPEWVNEDVGPGVGGLGNLDGVVLFLDRSLMTMVSLSVRERLSLRKDVSVTVNALVSKRTVPPDGTLADRECSTED